MSGILLLSVAGLLGGCSSDNDPTPVIEASKHQESNSVEGIPWFNGSVEDAFATAEREKKPIFLYWGAQWCPPCQELKSTIFRRQEFIEQSKLFVPVYLDGDTERAQRYGEQFGVLGYPTVIIFAPQGIEITRIPGGMNIEQYLGVLELALNALHPVGDLLRKVQAGQEIRDDDWRLLASYSWDQDDGLALAEGDRYKALQTLAEACPERLRAARSKLQLLAISAWASATERNASPAQRYGAEIERVLNDPLLSGENLQQFIQGGANMVNAMVDDEQRVAIRKRIAALLALAAQDPSLGALTRTDAIYGWVEVNRTSLREDEQLPPEQQAWVKAQVDIARSQFDRYQQHAGLSTISELYLNAGLVDDARSAMRDGMELSEQPYYFMSGMAHLESAVGNSEAAIAWHKKAWDAAQGPATRVQWGSSYISALIELCPDDIDAIRSASTSVLGELAQQKDGLYQRNSVRMDRLSQTLLGWVEAVPAATPAAEDRQRVVDTLRGAMDRLCAGLAADGAASATCDSFLVPI